MTILNHSRESSALSIKQNIREDLNSGREVLAASPEDNRVGFGQLPLNICVRNFQLMDLNMSRT